MSTNQINRFQMRINSIRQKSNSIRKQFSNIYSNFLIKFPWTILGISSFITIGLTVCFLLFMQIRPFDQNDFLTPNSQAMRNAFRLKQIFGNDTELRVHQQLNLYPALDIIIKRKLNTNEKNDNLTNMLNDDIIQEIHFLDKRIQSIRINNTNNSIQYNYTALCTITNRACVIDGNYILTDKFRQDIANLVPPASGYYSDPSGANGIPAFMFGKNIQLTAPPPSDYVDEDENGTVSTSENDKPLEDIISYIPLFRLRYSLNTSTPEMTQLALNWERELLRYLNEDYQSQFIDLFPSTSTAIKDTIAKKAHDEGFYMIFMIIIFFFLIFVFLSIQGNFHTSVGYLPLCGIISIALSTGATLGLVSLFRIQIIEPMALLVFIVAFIDCMRLSIVCGEYHRIIKEHLITITTSSSEIDLEKILPSIIESTHPYFIISTLFIIIIYLIFSVVSPMVSTMLIGLTLALYIFVNCIVHLTFFSSCLVITLKRVSSRRHSLLCYRLPTDYYTKTNTKLSKFKSLENRIRSLSNVDSVFKNIFARILCVLSIGLFVYSIWIGLSIDTRLFDDQFLPRDAYSLRSHMKSQADDFNIGPVIIFTIPENVDYENKEIRSSMNSLLEQCQNETRTNTFKLLWLDYQNVTHIIHDKEPLDIRITVFSHNDIIVSEVQNHSTIKASRFYCQFQSIKGDREDIRTMNNMYTYANQSSIPSIFPYSLVFPNYESLSQIRIEMCFLILLLIICTFICTFISFISLITSLLIIFHLILLLTSTLTCLYLFHNLTFNFADALWLYVIPITFIDTLMHLSYNITNSKWKYNRVILSLIISLICLYIFPIQSYVFRIICDSLMYQSIICLILINLILPSWNYLIRKKESIKASIATVIDVNQSLTNGIEIKNGVHENLNSTI